jgi:hypothetical protein
LQLPDPLQLELEQPLHDPIKPPFYNIIA